MAKKKPGTGKQDDEVEEAELEDEELDEGTDETEDESETDDGAADDEAGDNESDEDDEQTAEELKAQLAKMQRALKKANREAASRRIELEALKKKPAPKAGDKAKGKGGDGNDEAEELRTLREQNEKLLAEQRRNGARLAIAKAARKAKINWANDTARDDAVELILRDAVINEDGTIDDVADLLAEVVEERPHLLAAKAGNDKKPRAGDTSATKRGSRTDLALDEDEIAQQFGIRDHRPTKK